MNIIAHKTKSLIFSLFIVLASIGVLFANGLNLGVDFEGGSLMEVQFIESTTTTQVASILDGIESSQEVVGSPKIQPSDNGVFVIRTRELNDENHAKTIEALSGIDGYEELSFTRIGPVVGQQLREKAVISIFIAILLIVVFIAYAFRKVPAPLSSLRFGLVAVITLIHDVLFSLGVFALFGLEIDSFFITAMLTVLGYSVNDTIVVFDRIRETVQRKLKPTFEEAAEYSIQSTIMRSINTSVTLLITLIALYLFAAVSIKNFILAVILGVSVGTYSSIFLATPLLVAWEGYIAKSKATKVAQVDGKVSAGKKKNKAKKK